MPSGWLRWVVSFFRGVADLSIVREQETKAGQLNAFVVVVLLAVFFYTFVFSGDTTNKFFVTFTLLFVVVLCLSMIPWWEERAHRRSQRN